MIVVFDAQSNVLAGNRGIFRLRSYLRDPQLLSQIVFLATVYIGWNLLEIAIGLVVHALVATLGSGSLAAHLRII